MKISLGKQDVGHWPEGRSMDSSHNNGSLSQLIYGTQFGETPATDV